MNFLSYRFRFADSLILAAILGCGFWFVGHVDETLDYDWNWSSSLGFLLSKDGSGDWRGGLLMTGLLTTFRLTVWSGVVALVIGVAIALCRVSRWLFLRMIGAAYVELVRNMPPLVFMFVFYFFISSQIMPLLGVDAWANSDSEVLGVMFGPSHLLENFFSGMVCLAMFEGAYVAEIIRGGIQSIEPAQWEGGKSLGMGRWKVMRLIVFPQAFRKVLPPLTGQLVSLVKDSSVISVISVQELTFAGTETAVSSGRIFETWIIVALLYFAICFPISMFFRWMESSLSRGTQKAG